MILIQTLEEPINGYWDGGKQSFFKWHIEGQPLEDKQGKYIRVGSWGANHWFYVALGRTQKQTLANARRKLTWRFKKQGIKSTFEYAEGKY